MVMPFSKKWRRRPSLVHLPKLRLLSPRGEVFANSPFLVSTPWPFLLRMDAPMVTVQSECCAAPFKRASAAFACRACNRRYLATAEHVYRFKDILNAWVRALANPLEAVLLVAEVEEELTTLQALVFDSARKEQSRG